MSILNLAWLIPAFPFLAFIAISLGAHRSRKLSHSLAIAGIAIAFALSQIVFWVAVTKPVGGGEHAFEGLGIPWLAAGEELSWLTVYLDPASTVMLFMVPLVCLMIFIYSVGYMQGDSRYSRFFAYICLFATGMLGLVVFNSLLTLFIFWEIMGTCSYLLIGFWYEKESAMNAGLKAFLVTKVGDLFLMLGLVLLYAQVGSLAYKDVFSAETLHALAHAHFLGTNISMATLISLLIFGGTVGKSAQFPLHVWLPDAMEGPTPVSALIHAATMVSAGVYLVVRIFPLLAVSEGMGFVAFTGTFTAIFASLIAIAQNDIKRVLAFSTISQLGYMVAALGVGAYVAGAFHLITHAFFKALLFLASGSVIHGMDHGHHHVHEHAEHHDEDEAHDAHGSARAHEPFNPNDMLNMGGLGKRMPRTAISFLAGALALSGFPLFTAGFWSKDEILAQAWELNPTVFWVLAIAAGMTAFYTARQLCLTFLGEPRTEAAEHAPESVASMTTPLLILAFFAITLGWAGIPEHFPIIGGLIPNWFHHFVLSTIEAGGEHTALLRVPGLASEVPTEHGIVWPPLVLGLTFALGGLGAGWLIYGRKPLEAGDRDPVEVAMRKLKLGWLYNTMRDRFYFDEIYQATFVAASIGVADLFAEFDRYVVDWVVNFAASVGRALALASDWFDSHIVDPLVNGAGALGLGLSQVGNWLDVHVVDFLVDLAGWLGRGLSVFLDVFDLGIVDGIVNGIGRGIRWIGHRVRQIQTGMLQDYLWDALLMVLLLVAILVLFRQI